MGWKTDWLYQRVFDQAKHLWKDVHFVREEYDTSPASAKLGIPPDYFLITQYVNLNIKPYSADSNFLTARFTGSAFRRWIYDTDGLRYRIAPEDPKDLYVVRGMYHKVGRFLFSLSTDRKQVLISYGMGPLFGREIVYQVLGQGKNGLLVPDSKFVHSIS